MYITRWTVALAALAAVPAGITASTAIAWLWVACTMCLACLDALAAPATRDIGVQRTVTKSVRLTERATSVVSLANRGRRSIRGTLRDAWPPSAGAHENRHAFRVGPFSTARVTTVLTPTRRGDRRAAGVTVRLRGPLGLAGRQRTIPSGDVLRVLPEFRSRRHLPSRLARLREIDGQTSVNLRGAGSEFDSLREYVIGDDVRSIDWRATARRADVVVKTFRPERDRRVFIVLESARQSAGRVGDEPRLDASMEATLLLTALASKAGDRVQAVAWDRSERARALGSTGASVMPALANAMANVEARLVEPDWAGLVDVVDERLSQRSLVVILTTVDSTCIDSGLLRTVRALSHKHQVLVGSVADPELDELAKRRDTIDDVYNAAAAERGDLESRAIAMRLRQFGAEVVFGLPAELAPRVADAYLALKASGKL